MIPGFFDKHGRTIAEAITAGDNFYGFIGTAPLGYITMPPVGEGTCHQSDADSRESDIGGYLCLTQYDKEYRTDE